MKKKILIVEDDSVLQSALMDCFSKEDYDVLVSSNVMDAFRQIEDKKPDIILTDLIMANLNGFEILKRIKDNAHLNDIPVIVMSNSGQEKDVKDAMSLGAKDFLLKANLSLKEIVKRVNKVASKS